MVVRLLRIAAVCIPIILSSTSAAMADPVVVTRGEVGVSASFVSTFWFVSAWWNISSTEPIGGDTSVAWNDICLDCPVTSGDRLGGGAIWNSSPGPDAKGTVYGEEFPSWISGGEDEYGTLLLLPDLQFTITPFTFQPGSVDGSVSTTFRMSGWLEGRDLRADQSFVFRDAVAGSGRVYFDVIDQGGGSFELHRASFDFAPASPVPEPTTLFLVAAGAVIGGRRALQRRN
jgi:hypothetical protein